MWCCRECVPFPWLVPLPYCSVVVNITLDKALVLIYCILYINIDNAARTILETAAINKTSARSFAKKPF
jgi:hypothetical protein